MEKVAGRRKGLKLTDILVTIVIAFVLGLVYKLVGPLYSVLMPFGLQLEQFMYGIWFIAAPIAFLIIRKPGVALLAEVAASQIELLFGSQFGLTVLMYGIFQGLFAELVFMAFGYKRFTIRVVSLAAVGSTIGSLIIDFYYKSIPDLALWNLTLLIGARTIGAIVIAVIFSYYLVKALEKTGVTNLVRPASKEDYQALEK